MLFEQYSGAQEYIEDCEVCCSPIKINYFIDGDSVCLKSVNRLDD